MSDDDSDKSYEPTPQKLEKARKKGEVPKSTDLNVAASYLGLIIAIYVSGADVVEELGTVLMSFLDQPDRLADLFFGGAGTVPVGGIFMAVGTSSLPIFIVPMAAVLLSIIAQRALVFAPSKLEPKLSKISIISNAKNKFGRSGLFEFFKSTVKLVLYSVCMGVYLNYRLPDMIASSATGAFVVVMMMAQLALEFLILALIIALGIGVIDASFQQAEHNRKNMMSRQEIMDESKESEGDPHLKGARRQKAHEIAMGQGVADVAEADVVIVNPTHYAVALKWDRAPGQAPICVAKGVDEVAAVIREVANENGVPIHSDPPTARALHAAVDIGEEIHEEHFAPVAAAIRFAEKMRQRAKGMV
ncbi:flagellar type III secretion system protein FlhB [Phaeobacter gallaeciensis]|uniref:Flagellar biosynthetic protein FlhB n=1 Tax=Phaeobacter gallaeciensis TaxID=60890 RepID=A0AAC9ZBA1_9RHOB|nr:flagellar type III secretion system protein FlhB [Phaeobacter gallaeciensis]AHD11354.1 Flagellar biosynthesis pathway, component FlhB [Phaeobacter gallaeciensis DSM 26640]ATE94617.1 flagellar biosynthetic protein FlhB [Phaeobacter gallaeciensis]ATE98890.1 flagellar biosynthetic protein FlhB [Phaeobacter gallaeciensis]ATF03281.1 flagellar biosynthetic protein FlhB [Phaeobacter gallaeciensis]ATF07661.1 flagellar biosynthetic protein FlhB [Phaeobacter gallaeciensis]